MKTAHIHLYNSELSFKKDFFLPVEHKMLDEEFSYLFKTLNGFLITKPSYNEQKPIDESLIICRGGRGFHALFYKTNRSIENRQQIRIAPFKQDIIKLLADNEHRYILFRSGHHTRQSYHYLCRGLVKNKLIICLLRNEAILQYIKSVRKEEERKLGMHIEHLMPRIHTILRHKVEGFTDLVFD